MSSTSVPPASSVALRSTGCWTLAKRRLVILLANRVIDPVLPFSTVLNAALELASGFGSAVSQSRNRSRYRCAHDGRTKTYVANKHQFFPVEPCITFFGAVRMFRNLVGPRDI